MVSQLAIACHEQERTTQSQWAHMRNMLVPFLPPAWVVESPCGSVGLGCCTVQHQASPYPKPSPTNSMLLGPHFNPHDQISMRIWQTGEKYHFPDCLVTAGAGEGSARVRGTFMRI